MCPCNLARSPPLKFEMIVFPCHVCRTDLSAEDAQSGQLVRCPTCLTTLRVPSAAVQPADTAVSSGGFVGVQQGGGSAPPRGGGGAATPAPPPAPLGPPPRGPPPSPGQRHG